MPENPKNWTIIDLLQQTQLYFAKCGIQSPRLDAELLLAHCLEKDRLRLYLEFDALVTAQDLSRYRALVVRRAKREPLAYITGFKDFWSLRLRVTPDVLIPRPETEVLVEQTIGFIKEGTTGDGLRILDIGTGSGAIALSLAAELPEAEITAIDISRPALEIARGNADACCPAARLNFLCGDSLVGIGGGERFDCIVSNPPYIATGEIETLEPEIRNFEPRLALDGGCDGLDFYRSCIAQLPACLNPGGIAVFEIGSTQGPAVRELLSLSGFSDIRVIADYSRNPRVITARLISA